MVVEVEAARRREGVRELSRQEVRFVRMLGEVVRAAA